LPLGAPLAHQHAEDGTGEAHERHDDGYRERFGEVSNCGDARRVGRVGHDSFLTS
jgi:hypothetical protein